MRITGSTVVIPTVIHKGDATIDRCANNWLASCSSTCSPRCRLNPSTKLSARWSSVEHFELWCVLFSDICSLASPAIAEVPLAMPPNTRKFKEFIFPGDTVCQIVGDLVCVRLIVSDHHWPNNQPLKFFFLAAKPMSVRSVSDLCQRLLYTWAIFPATTALWTCLTVLVINRPENLWLKRV